MHAQKNQLGTCHFIIIMHCRMQAAVGNVLAAVIPRARIVPAVRGEDMSGDRATVGACFGLTACLCLEAANARVTEVRLCRSVSGVYKDRCVLDMAALTCSEVCCGGQIKLMEEDPLNNLGNLRARTAHQILRAFAHVQQRERELALPIYAHHGTRDRLADVQVGRAVLSHTTSPALSCRMQQRVHACSAMA